MRDRIRQIVIQAIAGTTDLTIAIDQLCDLHNVSFSLDSTTLNKKDMKCNICGTPFNEANIREVFEHEHEGIKTKEKIGKKVISHAREVYPYCSGEFAGGVYSYLSGDDVPKHPDSNEFRSGYFSAQRDLADKYTLRK